MTRPRPRRLRLPASLLLVIALVLAAAPLTTAGATHEWEVVQREFFFTGDEHDQINKLDRLFRPTPAGELPSRVRDSRTPTFTQHKPDGEEIRQWTTRLGTNPYTTGMVGSPLEIYWVGSVDGRLGGGPLRLTLHLSGGAPAGVRMLQAQVYTDIDWTAGSGTLIGSTNFTPVTGTTGAEANTIEVPMPNGLDVEEIVVQVKAMSDAVNGVAAHYNSAAAPSGFSLSMLVPKTH